MSEVPKTGKTAISDIRQQWIIAQINRLRQLPYASQRQLDLLSQGAQRIPDADRSKIKDYLCEMVGGLQAGASPEKLVDLILAIVERFEPGDKFTQDAGVKQADKSNQDNLFCSLLVFGVYKNLEHLSIADAGRLFGLTARRIVEWQGVFNDSDAYAYNISHTLEYLFKRDLARQLEPAAIFTARAARAIFADDVAEQKRLITAVGIKVADKAHYEISSAEFKRLALQELERE
jgi:hypothetical protein